MIGKIRSKENCPKCRRKFALTVIPEIGPYLQLGCAPCLTRPRKYFIDLTVKSYGRLKLYTDRQGNALSSWQHAERVLTGIRYEIDQRIFDPTKYTKSDITNFLFETRIEAWYASKEKEVEKGNLARSYTLKLKCYKDLYYLPHFRGMDVREIRTFHIHEFYEKLPLQSHKDEKEKISLKYIKNIVNGLENFFNTLRRLDYIKEQPGFPVITIDRRTPKWVDRKTQLEILKAVPEEHRPVFSFLCFQGVRPGEGRALRVKDITFRDESVTISRTFSGALKEVKERVKSKVVKPRALNPILIPMLEEACKNKHPEAYVFTQRSGRHYSEKKLRKIWEAARDSVGLDITLYEATRHSFASNAVTDEIPLNIIKEVMGHTDIKSTLIYASVNLTSQRVMFKKQSEIVSLGSVPNVSPRPETGIKKNG
jgi:integrase